MDIIILAGGLGTRLREVVSDVPKPLAPINGKPFLDILLHQLHQFSQKAQLILSIGYKKEAFKSRYPHCLFSEEETPLGTGGALKKALTLTKTPDVLVLNGDSYFDVDLVEMVRSYFHSGADITMASRKVEDISRYGAVDFDAQQRVKAFIEKEASKLPGWINGGIYLLKKNLLDSFPDTPFSLEKEGFPNLLQKRFFAYPASGTFIDIGTKESYHQAQEMGLSR